MDLSVSQVSVATFSSAFCLLPSAFCLLPSAFWFLVSGFCFVACGFLLPSLPSTFTLLISPQHPPLNRHFERSKPTLFLPASLLRGARLAQREISSLQS